MKELADEQVDKAREEWCKALQMPYTAFDVPLAKKCFNGIAPFLQLPWDEPTDSECAEAVRALSASNAVISFVRRRNESLFPKPVDPRRNNLHKLVMRYKTSGQPAHPERMVDEILAALDEVK